MHKFAKQIAECLKSKVEGKGIDNLNLSEVEELKAWSEIIKNIVCYDKDYRIIEAMDKEEKEEEESEKYFLKMLKEEYGIHSWGNSNTRAYIYKDLQGNIISDIAVNNLKEGEYIKEPSTAASDIYKKLVENNEE